MTAKVTATPANVGNWQKSHKMVRKSNNLLRICILIFLYIARGPKSSLSVFPSVEGSKNETRDSLCWMRRRRFVHWWCYCVHSLSCCVLPLTCHAAMIQPFPYCQPSTAYHTNQGEYYLLDRNPLRSQTKMSEVVNHRGVFKAGVYNNCWDIQLILRPFVLSEHFKNNHETSKYEVRGLGFGVTFTQTFNV